ncbi:MULTISPECIES: hypothetical protein [unclassified Deinococcus]|uniref:hypothetical protein n=1 Tax=unclassified Deinococcus TaxID=2623546 RepID=UPI001C303461|nr:MULTISPECIES: hypothetical protein [unclassified Deinococcus]MDK2014470.1 hypothetical protein [Deinococcus sp. 43]
MPKTTFADHDDLTLDEKLERFAMLRDTITGLEEEKKALGDDLKAAMLRGDRPLYAARLQVTQKVTYPLDQFRDLYGDAAAFEVAAIDPKKVKALVKAGDLDVEGLERIGGVREQYALCLKAK